MNGNICSASAPVIVVDLAFRLVDFGLRHEFQYGLDGIALFEFAGVGVLTQVLNSSVESA